MGKFETFEDIEAWQEAKALAVSIYSVSNVGEFSKDYSFKDQLRRSAVSISSNIAEGFERQGDKEFSRFLYIAKGSCGELRSQLYIAKELKYLTEDEFKEFSNRTLKISKMISGLIKYLNK
ncbi:MAG: four helix bundle protein [Bacteroidia bacterium]